MYLYIKLFFLFQGCSNNLHHQHLDVALRWRRYLRHSGSPGPGTERGRWWRRQKWTWTCILDVSRSCFKTARIAFLGRHLLYNARGKNFKIDRAQRKGAGIRLHLVCVTHFNFYDWNKEWLVWEEWNLHSFYFHLKNDKFNTEASSAN